jgi:hypothetical protein
LVGMGVGVRVGVGMAAGIGVWVGVCVSVDRWTEASARAASSSRTLCGMSGMLGGGLELPTMADAIQVSAVLALFDAQSIATFGYLRMARGTRRVAAHAKATRPDDGLSGPAAASASQQMP